MNITFVLCSKRSKKSKRRTFAFKVRLLLFLAYREGTLNFCRACLSWLYKEILLICFYLIYLLINTSAPSHWLKSVACPVGPVLKFRDIPD